MSTDESSTGQSSPGESAHQMQRYEDDADLPQSPATPVRFRGRLAARGRRARTDQDTDSGDWSWDLPPTPATERPHWRSPATEPATSPEPVPTADPDDRGSSGESGHAAQESLNDGTHVRPVRSQPAAADLTEAPADLAAVRSRLGRSTSSGPDPAAGAARADVPDPGGPEPASGAALRTAQPTAEPDQERADQPNPKAAAPDTDVPGKPGSKKSGPPKPGAEKAGAKNPAAKNPAAKNTGPKNPGAKNPAAKKPAAKKPAAKNPAANKPGDNKPGDNKPGPKKAGVKKAAAVPTRQRFKVLQGVAPRTPRPEMADESHLPAEQRRDLAVRVTNLSITYRTSFEKKPTFRQAVLRLGRGQRAVREIKALQDVSFEVKTGRSVGIIGRNGAGKSTLMRSLAGILPPTSGTVEVWGRASTLLALGVGFNASLSGRENIILGGLASGMSMDEVEERANEIAEWTELGDFIDMPMRTYSSGMSSRVAFAVAVHTEPDILMIDEGLSTGDAHFKDKASAKMAELRDKARAMFLVSHGMGSITELCDEAIWIDKGHLMARGEPQEIADQYLNHLKASRKATTYEDV